MTQPAPLAGSPKEIMTQLSPAGLSKENHDTAPGPAGGWLIPVAQHYYINGNMPDFVSADKHTLIIPFVLEGTRDEATAVMERVREEMAAANEASETFFIAIVGQISSELETNEVAVSDIEKGEQFGIPVALVILLILFGSVIAALIPLLLHCEHGVV